MPRIRAENIQAHKELTRQQILDVGAELFVSQGYGNTTLGDIAAEIGIGRTTLYEYFSDKEEVLVTLVAEQMPQVLESIIGATPADAGPMERLGELVLGHLSFVADESNLGTLLMREGPTLSPAAQRQIGAAHRELETEIRAAYKAGIEAGELRDVPLDQAAELVNALVMGAARYLLRLPDPKGELHRLSDELLNLLFHGIAVH